MAKIDKINHLSFLFDEYKSMLTKKQVDIFTKYYMEDLSLAEISKENGISREGVSDALRNIEKKITLLENNLKLGEKNKKLNNLIDLYEEKGEEKIVKILKELL